MAEDNNNESSGVLANALFSQGFKRLSDYYNRTSKYALDRGAKVSSQILDNKAKEAMAHSMMMSPSPLLSEKENEEYLKLLNKTFSVSPDGSLIENNIDESERRQLAELFFKGYPEPKKK